MKDIKQSMEKALIEQGWIFGDKATRIGSPFVWAENEHKNNILNLEGLYAIGFYFSMWYVVKRTPRELMIHNHEKVSNYMISEITRSFRHFFPFLKLTKDWNSHIEAQALARSQDYFFLKKFCEILPSKPHHIDIGPGLGCAAIASIKFLNSFFYALEASPMSYAVQRHYFRFLSPVPGAYLDVIECENYQLPAGEIMQEINKNGYRIKHIPSWRFPWLLDGSMDILSATFVLNELNYSGIFWILSNASRVIKKGGYFYIRDSEILKPGTHTVEYDKVLLKIGFEKVSELRFENRHIYFGIPRLYRKINSKAVSFEEIVGMCLGKYASVAAGSDLAYNLDKMPKL
ncbi:MAG: hypothetical protein V1869_01080 [Candidatus Omnitrophota bacterium]